MKKSTSILAALAAVALIASPAGAQVQNPDARVDLRVEGRALSLVVEALQEASGANVVIVEGGDTPISIELTDVHWFDALELAAELAECVVEERTAGVLVIDKPPRVNFVFTNAEITEVIDAIAAISGANVVVAPEVSGTISVRLQNVPWREALEVSVKTLGFTVVQEDRGILRVVDPLTLQAQMETRTYRLRYLHPPTKYVPLLKSEFLQPVKAKAAAAGKEVFPIVEALRKALSKGGDLDYVVDLNALIVRDTTQVHGDIEDIIDRLDVEPAQIFFDIKFVSTTTSDAFNLGFDYGDAGPSVSYSGGQVPITLPFNLGDGGFEDLVIANPTGTGPFADLAGNAGGTIIPTTVFGALSFTDWMGTLRMLQQDSRTEVIQAPKLVTLDGRAATIFVGETIRYAEARSEVGQTGSLQLSVAEASGSPVEVGFQLLIVPHIVPGTNTVMMDVIPKETSLSGTSDDTTLAPPGFDFFTVGSGGGQGSIALPRIRTSTIVTSMLLDSGQTAVVGGLSTDAEVETTRSVPLLSKIPLLGPALFEQNSSNIDRRSLLIFISVRVVRTAKDTERILEKELQARREIYAAEYDRLFADIGQDDDFGGGGN